MAMTKSVEHKSNLLQMIPINGHRISQQWKLPVFLKLGYFLNARCLLSCSVLFLFLAALGLNFGFWDPVPWPRIKLRPPALGAQSPIPRTKVPPKIRVLSQVLMLARLSGSADPRGSLKLLWVFRNPWTPAFILETYRVVHNVETKTRHDSCLKLLSVDWGAG